MDAGDGCRPACTVARLAEAGPSHTDALAPFPAAKRRRRTADWTRPRPPRSRFAAACAVGRWHRLTTNDVRRRPPMRTFNAPPCFGFYDNVVAKWLQPKNRRHQMAPPAFGCAATRRGGKSKSSPYYTFTTLDYVFSAISTNRPFHSRPICRSSDAIMATITPESQTPDRSNGRGCDGVTVDPAAVRWFGRRMRRPMRPTRMQWRQHKTKTRSLPTPYKKMVAPLRCHRITNTEAGTDGHSIHNVSRRWWYFVAVIIGRFQCRAQSVAQCRQPVHRLLHGF